MYVATIMSECGFPKYLLWSMSPSTCYGENQSLVFLGHQYKISLDNRKNLALHGLQVRDENLST